MVSNLTGFDLTKEAIMLLYCMYRNYCILTCQTGDQQYINAASYCECSLVFVFLFGTKNKVHQTMAKSILIGPICLTYLDELLYGAILLLGDIPSWGSRGPWMDCRLHASFPTSQDVPRFGEGFGCKITCPGSTAHRRSPCSSWCPLPEAQCWVFSTENSCQTSWQGLILS